MTDDEIITEIIEREGGFVNAAADRGKATKYGITQATLADYLGRPVTVAEVEALSESVARDIYRRRYILRPGFDAIADDALRAAVVDCAVNHGPLQATKFLQHALGVLPDGRIGPDTLAALSNSDPHRTRTYLVAERARFYGKILGLRPEQSVFAAGWMNRLAGFIEGLA